MKKGRPSETAARIAVNAVVASLDPVLRRLCPDPGEPFSQWFVDEHSPEARQHLAAWRTRGPMMRVLADALAPGGALFVLARKLWLEERVRGALAGGAAQVAVLGAGYDTLCLRLLRDQPGLRCLELDHPDTQSVKRRALERHGALPPGLSLLPLDLAGGGVAEALLSGGWDASRPGVAVAEGVLMYLDEAEASRVLDAARRALGGGGRFLFTVMDRGKLADRSGQTARTARMLAFSGEPIRWAVEREGLAALLEARGFGLRSLADHSDLRAAYLEPRQVDRPLSEGELLVEAEPLG